MYLGFSKYYKISFIVAMCKHDAIYEFTLQLFVIRIQMATILCGIYIKYLWFSVSCQWAFFRNLYDFWWHFHIKFSATFTLKELANIL